MKILYIPLLAIATLSACSQQPSQPEASAGASAPVETAPPARPVGQPFQNPLPQGVLLIQPHNATMDVPVENANGGMGRRTEFEFLDGDSVQAMSEFAQAMSTAGFVTVEGPSNEAGVVRQVFKKAGYGSVFARAQAQDEARRKHEKGIGFVVVAWPPEGDGAPPATATQ